MVSLSPISGQSCKKWKYKTKLKYLKQTESEAFYKTNCIGALSKAFRTYFHILQLDTREIHKKSALHSLHRLLGLFAMMRQVNGNVLARYKMCQVDHQDIYDVCLNDE